MNLVVELFPIAILTSDKYTIWEIAKPVKLILTSVIFSWFSPKNTGIVTYCHAPAIVLSINVLPYSLVTPFFVISTIAYASLLISLLVLTQNETTKFSVYSFFFSFLFSYFLKISMNSDRLVVIYWWELESCVAACPLII